MVRDMKRRSFVKLGAAGAAAVALGAAGSALAGEGASAGTPAYTPGTYTASAKGKKGHIVIETTFSDTAIESISLVSSHDTERAVNAAYTALSTDIVELQSLNVDMVSGATYSSVAIMEAVRDCVEQAGGDVDALNNGARREKSKETQELEADVVVVGAGAAGLCFSVKAAEAGLRVVVMEKAGFLGGNVPFSDGRMFYPAAPVEYRAEITDAKKEYFERHCQQAIEMGLDEGIVNQLRIDADKWYADGNTTVFDSPEWMGVDRSVLEGNIDKYQSHYDSTAGYQEQSRWFYEELGVEIDIPIKAIAGYHWPRSAHPADSAGGEAYVQALERHIDEAGLTSLDFLLSTRANELIVEDGTVVGVKGTCADGTAYVARGARGVVLATGGYGASKEWLQRLDPEIDAWGGADSVQTCNPSGRTGDGLDMAEAVGALIEGTGNIMLIPNIHPETSVLDHAMGDGANALLVNTEGKRFVDETASRTTMALAVMEQPGQLNWRVSCQANSQNNMETGRNFAGELIEPLFEEGLAFRADTLEELAETIGVPVDAFLETVESYNELCRTGGPDEFGREYFEEYAAIGEGPYYATAGTWGTLCTYGGIKVDGEFHVLDTDREPLPGLYAIGEVAGQPTLGACFRGLTLAHQWFD